MSAPQNSPYLDQASRSREMAALQVTVRALRRIPGVINAQLIVRRIEDLMPEAKDW